MMKGERESREGMERIKRRGQRREKMQRLQLRLKGEEVAARETHLASPTLSVSLPLYKHCDSI
jgi:hypothetical protein